MITCFSLVSSGDIKALFYKKDTPYKKFKRYPHTYRNLDYLPLKFVTIRLLNDFLVHHYSKQFIEELSLSS